MQILCLEALCNLCIYMQFAVSHERLLLSHNALHCGVYYKMEIEREESESRREERKLQNVLKVWNHVKNLL